MRILSLFLAICLLVACVPNMISAQETIPGGDYVVSDSIVEGEYKLGPGDEIEVNLIVGENDITLDHELVVGPDGKVYFPRVGEVNLLGLTIPEAKKLVNSRIRDIYKENYDFSFRLVQPRKVRLYLSGTEDKPLYMGEKKFVYVYGEVSRKGRFEYLPGKKFSDYISYAGGPTPRANLAAASITRGKNRFGINGSDVIFNGDSSRDMEILPGDVINVPANFFYFSDFGSFSSMIFTMVALYNTFLR
jgi:polysaccharide export outer membrane protein